jgi:hypothetical protein
MHRAISGAIVLVLSAAGFGLFATVSHPPLVVVAVTGALGVPAVLVWSSGHHRRSARSSGLLGALAVAMVAAEVVVVTRVYDHYTGSTHPESNTPRVAVDEVVWAWLGDLRPDGATVVAQLDDPGEARSVALTVERDGHEAVTAATSEPDGDGIVRLRAAGLEADATYRWSIDVDGSPDAGRGRGRFRTAPQGAATFTITAGACARTGSNASVFDTIRELEPLLHLITGDLHYANISSDDPDDFLAAFSRVLASPAQSALYRTVPIDYMWDDHDYGRDNADGSAPSRDAARTAYRQAVPAPPLVSAGPIHHAFTVGRVRIVVSDTRSQRSDQSMLGADQLAWLLDELSGAGRWGLVIWVNPVPWIAPAGSDRDDWGAYPDERQTIADAIAAAGVDNLVMVSGDAHMVAIDDGTNSDYSTSGGGGFPVLHAAALDRPGTIKGGPYSEGAIAGGGQFGLLHIDDDGTTVAVELEARDWTGRTLLTHRFVAGRTG